MIKEHYLGFRLVDLNLASHYEPTLVDPYWIASYSNPDKGYMLGCGYTIESAVAAAQKGIKKLVKGSKVKGLLQKGDEYEFRRTLERSKPN